MNKGFVFSSEALALLAVLLTLLTGLVWLAHNPTIQSRGFEWEQTKTMTQTQTNRITNTPFSNYQGPNDYYCYTLHQLTIGNGHVPQQMKQCEEIP